MSTIVENTITSSELGILWITYQKKSLMIQMIGKFGTTTTDQKAKDILYSYVTENTKLLDEIKRIFDTEKAVAPLAFGSQDVFNDAPALFDDTFHLMFLRIIAKVSLGLNSLHLGMSFRKDIRDFFKNSLRNSQEVFDICSDYLTKQGVLTRAPYVTMPKEVEFIESNNYMSGINILGNKRSLNTLEVAYVFNIIESNIMGMQLMSGFAQVAKDKAVRDYFNQGKELAKKIVSDFSSVLLESDIQPPTTWAGKATDSVVPPFSDKMMMFLSNILSSYALAGEGLGMAFGMRSDMPAKLAVIAKDTLDYAREGGKLMIKHKWLEEPPQMENRNQIIESKQ